MGKPNRIYALNVGSQSLTLAEFQSTSAGGLVLSGYQLEELPYQSLERHGADSLLEAILGNMVEALGLKSVAVNYAVSGQSVFTRFVRLPSVEAEKVDQIIQFEAQQNVPFPIQEVVWDYQLVGSSDEGQVEVVLVAIKADLLEELNGSVESAGAMPNIVDVAPMAIYNAYRYNYGTQSGCSLILDIGAKTTNLIFCEPDKIFSRSIPIGGSTITAAISKELQIPEEQAEEFKKKEGFVSLGGAYADPEDVNLARLTKLARNTMTRLHAEVNRSISFYKAQQKGSQPSRIYLGGGTVTMPFMKEFFKEKMQMPIEYLNPLRNVAIGSKVNPEKAAKQAHLLAEVVGLALRSSSSCPMELNLSPQSVVNAQRMKARQPFYVAAAACVVLTMLVWWGYLAKASAVKSSMLASLKAKVGELQGYERSIKKTSNEIKDLELEAKPLADASRARQFWAQALADLNQRLPDRFIWITYLEPLTKVGNGYISVVPEGSKPDTDNSRTSNTDSIGQDPQINALRIKGLYLENPRQATVVDSYVAALKESEIFSNPRVERRTTPTGRAYAYDYEIILDINNPIAVK